MTALLTLQTPRFHLFLIQKKDVQDVFQTMNNKNTADTITFLKWPITVEQAAAWCEKAVQGFKEQKEFLFIAKDKENGSPVGCISLHCKEEPDMGEIGYWVAESFQGKGVASEILKAMIDFGFLDRKLLRLTATAALENFASLRVLEKQGFKRIGFKDLPSAKGTTLTCHLLELRRT